jgi:hypothetical protein
MDMLLLDYGRKGGVGIARGSHRVEEFRFAIITDLLDHARPWPCEKPGKSRYLQFPDGISLRIDGKWKF